MSKQLSAKLRDQELLDWVLERAEGWHTLRETWTQETRDLLDQGIRSNESIVFTGKLLDQFLVFVELLEIIGGHGIHAVVLGPVDIVLVTEDTVSHPSSAYIPQRLLQSALPFAAVKA